MPFPKFERKSVERCPGRVCPDIPPAGVRDGGGYRECVQPEVVALLGCGGGHSALASEPMSEANSQLAVF